MTPREGLGIIATACSDIEERRTNWLWRGYIPRSTLTLLEGPPKVGKSTLIADLVARVSAGLDMPPPDKHPCERPGAVILISDEDAAAEVVVPRLRVANALLQAVYIIKAHDRENRPRQFVIGTEDTARLERIIYETGAVLVVVDPLSVYMGGTDAHREQEVRQCLWHLTELAERTMCSILAVRHWKKARTGDALAQGGGSVGFSAAARSILSVDRAPDDKTVRVLAPRGNGQEYPSLAFRLESVPREDVACIKWEGISRHDADALASVRMTGEDRGALSEAEAFLRDLLLDGPVAAKGVLAAADAAGISKDTLRRAKASLGAKVSKIGLHGGWTWSLDTQGNRIFDKDAISQTVSSIPAQETALQG